MNGAIQPIQLLQPEWLARYRVLYEVIRVIGSRPLFLDLHLQRLNRSCRLSGLASPPAPRLAEHVVELLAYQPVAEQNLKVCLCFQSPRDTTPLQLAFLIPSAYPPASAYRHGVAVDYLPAQRASPNVKGQNATLREEADRLIAERGVHEVLLVDPAGNVTEGSRSNVFFVDGQTLVTARAQDVLEGVTRGVVIALARAQGIQCQERVIARQEVQRFCGAFLTGTSPKVLPIRTIAGHTYATIPETTRALITLYDARIQTEITGAN